MAQEVWTENQIVEDLRRIMNTTDLEPSPYDLKIKYGYIFLSEFFPVLERISVGFQPELGKFISEIFGRVNDPRDLNFIKGRCGCETCRGY